MATPEYREWVAAGRPWDLARPVAQVKAWAEANDVDVLGTIGNEAHLTSNFPQDHTPFSRTAWPVPLPGFWVCAIDLADVRGLGSLILTMARDGELPWLKYMNHAGRNYAFADKFRQGSPNPDQHIHLSVFSDDLRTDIGNFDPLSLEDDDMELTDQVDLTNPAGGRWSFGNILNRDQISVQAALGYAAACGWQVQHEVVPGLKATEARLDALAEALEGIIPGVAQACAEAAAKVTAAEVAGELEVRAKGT